VVSEPDEAAVEAVAEVLAQNRNPFPLYPPTVMGLDRDEACLMLATPVVAEAFRDAERLRNLAARFEGHDDWDRSFLGEQIAAILRDGGQ